MSWVDLVGIGVLGVFVGVGAVRGFLAGVLSVASLVLSYLAGFAASVRLGAPLAERVGLNVILAGALAGGIAFATAAVVLGLISAFLRRRERESRGNYPRSAGDRLGGALVGGVQGGLLVLILYWLAAQAQQTGLLGGAPQEPGALARVSQDVIRSGAQAMIGERGGKLTANLIADPAGTLHEMEHVMETPAMRELQDDQLFWHYLSSGAVDSALNRSSFLRTAYDQSLRNRIVDLGLMGEEARTSPQAFRDATREVMQQIAPRLEQLRSDPALQALAADPEVQRALAEGNPIPLLRRREFRDVLIRTLSAPQPGTSTAQPAPSTGDLEFDPLPAAPEPEQDAEEDLGEDGSAGSGSEY
jgi:uncharacterized membrane protein required for colicin V production